ncbi:MAG: AAA family ATPase [Lachnospiraceae bacterium]
MSAINGVPLLVEGDPGVGKTSFAYATAKMLDLELLRVQFYDGLSYDKILYDYDYQKQLLTIPGDPGTVGITCRKRLAGIAGCSGKINFYGRDFLIERPILKAISGKKRYVLLLDEVEKASEEIEYTLLEVLENFSISIPQYGTVTCPEEMRPIVFLTSNRYRDLSQALKRRCNYLYIKQKTAEELKEILQMQSSIDTEFAESVANCAKQIRSLPLKQQPSISELSEWAKYLSMLNSDELEEETLKASLCMIAKNKEDRQTMENAKTVLMEECNAKRYL